MWICDVEQCHSRSSPQIFVPNKIIFLLLLSIFLPSASSSIPVDPPVSFSFSSFNPKSCSDGSLICMGAVTPSYGYLSLTSDPSQESPDQLPLKKAGRVLYSQPVTAWPAMISTTFTIRISPYPNATDSADGMTFVFATDTSPPTENSAGGNLGLSTDTCMHGRKLYIIAVK